MSISSIVCDFDFSWESALYINYMSLAIDPFLGLCYCLSFALAIGPRWACSFQGLSWGAAGTAWGGEGIGLWGGQVNLYTKSAKKTTHMAFYTYANYYIGNM